MTAHGIGSFLVWVSGEMVNNFWEVYLHQKLDLSCNNVMTKFNHKGIEWTLTAGRIGYFLGSCEVKWENLEDLSAK